VEYTVKSTKRQQGLHGDSNVIDQYYIGTIGALPFSKAVLKL